MAINFGGTEKEVKDIESNMPAFIWPYQLYEFLEEIVHINVRIAQR